MKLGWGILLGNCNMITVKKYMSILATMMMLITFLPFFRSNVPILRAYNIWVLIWIISLIVIAPKVIIHKLMLAVLFYGLYIYLLINYFTPDINMAQVSALKSEFYSIFISLTIFLYFETNRDYYSLAKLTKYSLFFIFTTAFLTIIVSFIFPSFSRDISVSVFSPEFFSTNEISKILRFEKFGAGTRGDGFAFMALIPIAIYFAKQKQIKVKSKWINLFIITVNLALIRMQFVALMIYAAVFTLLSLSSIKNRTKNITISLIFILLILLVPSRFFANMFYNIASIINQETTLGLRINDIGVYIEAGGGVIEGNAVSGRLDERYLSTFNYFIDNPLFGTYFLRKSTYGSIGENHLFLMNKMVTIGVLGFLLWGMIFYGFYKYIIRKINNEFNYYFSLALISLVSYGLIKGIIYRPAWALFFVIIPGMNYLPMLDKKQVV
jgi:hypothetical protein